MRKKESLICLLKCMIDFQIHALSFCFSEREFSNRGGGIRTPDLFVLKRCALAKLRYTPKYSLKPRNIVTILSIRHWRRVLLGAAYSKVDQEICPLNAHFLY